MMGFGKREVRGKASFSQHLGVTKPAPVNRTSGLIEGFAYVHKGSLLTFSMKSRVQGAIFGYSQTLRHALFLNVRFEPVCAPRSWVPACVWQPCVPAPS